MWADKAREDEVAAAEVRLSHEADQLQELKELRKEEEAEKKKKLRRR